MHSMRFLIPGLSAIFVGLTACDTPSQNILPPPPAQTHAAVAPAPGIAPQAASGPISAPPAPIRGRVPDRPADRAAATAAPSPAPATIPEAAMPPAGRSLPGPVQDALAGSAAEGAVIAAIWLGHDARFELGQERQAIRTLPILLAPAVEGPGPVELLGEPLAVVADGMLSLAPGRNGAAARNLIPGETLFAFALTGDRNWMLVGQDGVVAGYAPASLFAPLNIAPTPAASRQVEAQTARQGAILRTVPAATRCRGLVIATSGAVSTEEACLYPDGEWRLAPIS